MEYERHTRKHGIPWLVLSILLAFYHDITIAWPVSRDSDQQITFYITSTVPLTAPHTKPVGLFSGQGQIDPSTSFLTSLTPSHALEAGKLKFINQQIRGEGDIGEPLIGQVEGVQVTSLGDNTSSILALEASFASTTGETKDSLRFFGVHHADAAESHIAVVGGKGKYEEASGFAVIKGGGGPESSGNDFGFTAQCFCPSIPHPDLDSPLKGLRRAVIERCLFDLDQRVRERQKEKSLSSAVTHPARVPDSSLKKGKIGLIPLKSF
ncbi:hypothetical protein LUZ61_006978 [Rhynchospora tenuis]|uniref:Dirigent protein n=1 Tax=Rhynchospora tenuis TaxID=198213 RepID=A0AAD6EW40_9POAL|nr:hypothetical protein LUZ61_006978 [Rhynchospora tenuis]